MGYSDREKVLISIVVVDTSLPPLDGPKRIDAEEKKLAFDNLSQKTPPATADQKIQRILKKSEPAKVNFDYIRSLIIYLD